MELNNRKNTNQREQYKNKTYDPDNINYSIKIQI